MLFIAGGSAAQIPNGSQREPNAQNGHHIHVVDQQRQHGAHRKQDKGQAFDRLIAVGPAGAFQNLFQLIILVEESFGRRSHQNIQFIRQGGRLALRAEQSVNEVARPNPEQSQEARADERKADNVDPLQPLIHLLRGLHELLELFVGNAVVQQPFL